MSRIISDNTNFRLDEIRIAKCLKKTEFAALLEVSPSTISEIMHAGRIKRLPNKSLRILHKKINVNLNWLLTGEGEMFLPSPCTQRLDKKNKEKTNANISKPAA